MIGLFDASAFVKLLVRESGSEETAEFASGAEFLSASRLLAIEARAFLGRRSRSGRYPDEEIEHLRDRSAQLLGGLVWVDLDAEIIGDAGTYAERHLLRAADALHLAAAASAARRFDIVFATYDERLKSAARAERLRVFPA